MKALTIKDLALDKELGVKAMASVRGGYKVGGPVSQSNATKQINDLSMDASISVANGAAFLGKGAVSFDIDSHPTQTASNSSTSSNSVGWDDFLRKGLI